MYRFLLFCSIIVLSGCVATNPATGGYNLSLMSDKEREEVGHQTAVAAVKEYGLYEESDKLSTYLKARVSDVVRVSETPHDEFRLRLLDSEQINAFATPGYTMINRGILAYFNSEGEMMSVVGHEIGHVTALHIERSVSKGRLLSVLLQGGLLIAGQQGVSQPQLDILGQVGGLVGGVGMRSWSRGHETEADQLGIRYLSRLCYNLNASAEGMETLQRHHSLYEKLYKMTGKTVNKGVFDQILSTHPETGQRITTLRVSAAETASCGQIRHQDRYFQMIDGMAYGRKPGEGFGGKNRFYDAHHKFTFIVPEGWFFPHEKGLPLVLNTSFPVIMDGALEKVEAETSTREALITMFPTLSDPEIVQAEGQALYTVSGNLSKDGENLPGKIRVFAFKDKPKSTDILMLIFKTEKEEHYKELEDEFFAIAKSLKRLNKSQAEKLQPLRVKIHQVKSGETVSSLSGKMAVGALQEEYFRTLNDFPQGKVLKVGMKVKLIVDPNERITF